MNNMKIIGWQAKISDHELSRLKDETNKEYVAGYFMGRLKPIYDTDHKQIIIENPFICENCSKDVPALNHTDTRDVCDSCYEDMKNAVDRE